MKLPSRIAFATLAILSSSLSIKAGEPVKHTNPAPPAFSDEKPAYLYFKEGTFTRTGAHRMECELKLAGEIPLSSRKQEIVYTLNFDIDNDGSTGKEFITFPGFGKDVTVWLKKDPNQSKFAAYPGTLVVKGKNYDVEITQFKVNKDTVSIEMKSELFADYPVSRVYAMSNHTFFDKGVESSDISVDQFPRKGALSIPQ